MFFRSLLNAPSEVGAVIPSSKWLASEMARWVRPEPDGFVVELGGGTGVVTAAVLARGIAPEHLIVVEKLPGFAALLRERFPSITVIEGDAFELASIIRSLRVRRVCAVVSSLPLRNFGPQKINKLIGEIHSVLCAGGRWIQFGYHLYDRSLLHGWDKTAGRFDFVYTGIVWRNIPPARVTVYERLGK